MLWKLLIVSFLMLLIVFIRLLFAGVPVGYALCIFIYPVMLLIAYIVIIWIHDMRNDKKDNDKPE